MLSMEKAKWLKLHGQSNMSTGDPPYSVQGLSQTDINVLSRQNELKSNYGLVMWLECKLMSIVGKLYNWNNN